MTDTPLDNESGQALGTYPPPELLVAAFWKAIGRRDVQESGAEPQGTPQQNGSPPGAVDAKDGEVPQESETMPFEEWLEETLAAFRTAGGTVWEDHSDKQSQNQSSLGMVSEEDPLKASKALPTPPESREGASKEAVSSRKTREEADWRDEGDAGASSEDLALAFRRAFYRRRVRHEIANQADSAEKTTRTAAFPPRPATSFLWVTHRPRGNTRSIGIQNLSGLRARRAGAFLLRGEGEEPYRLLSRIRHHPEPRISLKPVFWRGGADQESPVVDHVDGTWTPQADREALRTLRERAATINQRIHAVVEGEEGTEDAGTARRLLRYVATRSGDFAPRRVEEGIVYPQLTPLLGGEGEERL